MIFTIAATTARDHVGGDDNNQVVMVEITVTTVMMVVAIDDGCSGTHDSCDKNSHDSSDDYDGDKFEIF